MHHPRLTSRTEQVADLLRQGMIEGVWKDTLPGRAALASELGCSHWTVEEAIRELVKEGVLVSQGAGRKRRIELSAIESGKRALKIRILLYEEADRRTDYLVDLLHQLQQAGHDARFAEKTLEDLRMNVQRIAGFTRKIDTDAWIVVSASREVVEWFAGQKTPAFALFGRVNEVPIASTALQKADAGMALVDKLVTLGHRRIVVIAREDRRKPHPGFLESVLLERIARHGIPTGAYNLPDWEDHPVDFRRLLDSLFDRNPATALIIDIPSLFIAAMQHLSQKGISAPRDVSLACCDYCPEFSWCHPEITHISWEAAPLLRRVVRWASSVGRGKEIRSKTFAKARLIAGGTIGPATR